MRLQPSRQSVNTLSKRQLMFIRQKNGTRLRFAARRWHIVRQLAALTNQRDSFSIIFVKIKCLPSSAVKSFLLVLQTSVQCFGVWYVNIGIGKWQKVVIFNTDTKHPLLNLNELKNTVNLKDLQLIWCAEASRLLQINFGLYSIYNPDSTKYETLW